ncbi:MAG: AraC family transcriptional regulator [Tannerella sp.]|jgi:AraC-like DNA-binding protein|nr:AraC family transcriptional regulator [Tannerella sp.]
MITRLVDTDLKEMTIDVPMPSLSAGRVPESGFFVTKNRYAEVSFREIRTPDYSVIDSTMCSRDDLKMYSSTEENDRLWFCAALQGSILCNNTVKGEEYWHGGEANLLTYGPSTGYAFLDGGKPFRMLEIMLPPAYLERMAALYPDVFGKIFEQHVSRRFLRAFPEHVRYCPRMTAAMRDLCNCGMHGNAARMYLDAKLFEILSLFLCRPGGGGEACPRLSAKDSEILLHAREMIERHYLRPLSLPDLAHKAGTNECKLKKGFRTLFGTTVFGYLLDYRMEMACRYLSDTDRTIQEIAESVGYEHHSHFTTAFRRKYSLSPQEYRTRMRG